MDTPDEDLPEDEVQGHTPVDFTKVIQAGVPIELTVEPEESGCRLDKLLALRLPELSRVFLRKAINAVGVKVDGHRTKASYRVLPGQQIVVILPDLPKEGPEPEDIPLDLLFEDEHLAVINKPPGMVVHPAKGHWSGTLASALQYHFDQLSQVGGPARPGIVHRLDRDTSGVIVVAKHDVAHARLSEQFAARTVEKEYFAISRGNPDRDGDMIDLPIGVDHRHREKMCIRRDGTNARTAQTFYQVLERFPGFVVIAARPKTGRTHQIRVHLTSVGCAILCDRLYGRAEPLRRSDLNPQAANGYEVLLNRQALHARKLKFQHPLSGEAMEIEAPLPADLNGVLAALREL